MLKFHSLRVEFKVWLYEGFQRIVSGRQRGLRNPKMGENIRVDVYFLTSGDIVSGCAKPVVARYLGIAHKFLKKSEESAFPFLM